MKSPIGETGSIPRDREDIRIIKFGYICSGIGIRIYVCTIMSECSGLGSQGVSVDISMELVRWVR